MPVYVIAEVSITNSKEYEEYKKLTPGSLTPFGGKFVVRGGKTTTLEGEWQPERIVVLEFPSEEKALAWYNSPEYAPAKAIRQRASVSKLILVDGAPVIPG
jgi:uncharacterized protein (DUF1330 family)